MLMPKKRKFGPFTPGERYGRLQVVEDEQSDCSGDHQVSCVCDCGREQVVKAPSLVRGKVWRCRGCTSRARFCGMKRFIKSLAPVKKDDSKE